MNLSPEAKALYEKLKKHNPAVLEKLREEHMEEFKCDVVRAGNDPIFNVVCFESSREFSLEGYYI
jgi:hypothetical protein